MNKITITDSEKFQEVIQVFRDTLPNMKNCFESERRNSIDIGGTDVWKGKAQEKLNEKYKMLEQNFDPIVETMDIYIRFLQKTLDDYKELEAQLNNKAEEFSEQLNVNS